MIIKAELITSRQNEAVKRLVSLDDKRTRDDEGVFSADGRKLFEEAVAVGAVIDSIYLSKKRKEQYLQLFSERLTGSLYDETRVFVLDDALFSRVSRENSPQGIITLVKYLDKIQNNIKIYKVASLDVPPAGVLFLDGIQDPGNLGTVIRSAVAFGIRDIVLSADCVDIYHPRVLRGAMGGIFRIRAVYTADMPACVRLMRQAGRHVYAAALRPDAKPLGSVPLTHMDGLVIGNEGHGISDAVSRACDASIYVPIACGTESLNAAAAASILLWEMREV